MTLEAWTEAINRAVPAIRRQSCISKLRRSSFWKGAEIPSAASLSCKQHTLKEKNQTSYGTGSSSANYSTQNSAVFPRFSGGAETKTQVVHVGTVGSLLYQQAFKMCFTHRICCEVSLYASRRLRSDQTLWLPQLKKTQTLKIFFFVIFRPWIVFLWTDQYFFARETHPTRL